MTAFRSLRSLGLLYVGRAGAAAVGLLVLPFLHDALGDAGFGMVGIILSLQALVVLLDFGLSITAGREMASLPDSQSWQVRPILRHAEAVIARSYSVLLIVGVVAALLVDLPLKAGPLAGLVVGLAFITHHNVCQVGLIARQDYVFAGLSQLVGTVTRHLFSVGCLLWIEASVEMFIYSQAAVSLLQAIVCRVRLTSLAGREPGDGTLRPRDRIALPLIVQGVAGAIAMQLDKPILGALSGPEAVAPYYLASVLAVVPISFLAGPVAQFFQPKILQAQAREDGPALVRNLRRTLAALLLSTSGPALVFIVAADPLTRLWLGAGETQQMVAVYGRILMLAGVIGSLGLIPTALLVGRREYRFMATTSTVLTGALMAGVVLFAARNNLMGLCVVYLAYHTLATVVLWARASRIEPSLTRAVLTLPAVALDLRR